MITLGKMWILYEVNTIFDTLIQRLESGLQKNMCLLVWNMKSSMLHNGFESILNDIVGCNAFRFMKTLENVYPYGVYKLVTNAMG
jgi:hypothetical protein